MAITLRQLRYFAALVEERHFGRAAARVHVSQPALSGQIRALETELGGPLIEREAVGLPLTPLGREVAGRAGPILADVRALERLAHEHDPWAVPLTLGLIPTVAPYLVPPLVPLLRTEGARVAIREAVTETLLSELEAGRLDAAVAALPLPRRGFATEPLFEDAFLLALPPDETDRPPSRPEEIDPERLLLLDEGHCLSEQALTACKLRPEERRVRVGAASLSTLARLVASGQGVTLIPEIAAETEGHGLKLAPFSGADPGRTVALVRPGRSATPAWAEPLAALLRKAGAAIPRRSTGG